MVEELLARFDDDAFARVLCVVAHPDDVEYGTSAAVAAWTSKGIDVAYLLLTRGEAGMDALSPERTAELRVTEQIAGSTAVGVCEVDFLTYPDGVLEYSLDCAATSPGRSAATVPTRWSWAPGRSSSSPASTRPTTGWPGLAALDAVRDAGNRWVFPELLDEGLEPWSPRWLLVVGDSRPTHGVDITGEPLERGIASLECHAAVPRRHPGPSAAAADAHRDHGPAGPPPGGPHAVLFRAHDFHAPPPIALEAMRLAEQEAPGA